LHPEPKIKETLSFFYSDSRKKQLWNQCHTNNSHQHWQNNNNSVNMEATANNPTAKKRGTSFKIKRGKGASSKRPKKTVVVIDEQALPVTRAQIDPEQITSPLPPASEEPAAEASALKPSCPVEFESLDDAVDKVLHPNHNKDVINLKKARRHGMALLH